MNAPSHISHNAYLSHLGQKSPPNALKKVGLVFFHSFRPSWLSEQHFGVRLYVELYYYCLKNIKSVFLSNILLTVPNRYFCYGYV